MARRAAAAALEEIPAEADGLDGIPAPREQRAFVGHAGAERALLEAYQAGRPHHAWLLVGDRGIGKATLAFRFARFVLARPDAASDAVQGATSLATEGDEHGVRQIAIGAHPSLLHLKRPWDDKAKRFKTDLTVDEVRRLVPFLGSTSADGGYRIVIVDAAEDMNANAANALLKSLEEPPRQTLFLLVTHAAGRLLPTIRSRCRLLPMRPLAAPELEAALDALGVEAAGDERATVVAASGGSVRRAVTLLQSGSAAIAEELTALLDGGSAADRARIFVLADKLTAPKAAGLCETALDLAEDWFARRLKREVAAGVATAELAKLAEVWRRFSEKRRETAIYNLDRKELLLDLFETIRRARLASITSP